MSSREERIAKNEAAARDINEQLDEAHDDEPPSRHIRILCECGHGTCERVIAVTPAEYAEVRRQPERFAVLPEHMIADVERVVAEIGRFVVVAKRDGTPADVASEEDPRQ